MFLSNFDFDLPEELIAKRPASPRTSARLLVAKGNNINDSFVEDLWIYTIEIIRKDCGNYLTEDEETNLRDFFKEEGDIASNRDLYLPN